MNKARRERKRQNREDKARAAELAAEQAPGPVLFPASSSRDLVASAGLASAEGKSHEQKEEGS